VVAAPPGSLTVGVGAEAVATFGVDALGDVAAPEQEDTSRRVIAAVAAARADEMAMTPSTVRPDGGFRAAGSSGGQSRGGASIADVPPRVLRYRPDSRVRKMPRPWVAAYR
jgi:hypothetical protein